MLVCWLTSCGKSPEATQASSESTPQPVVSKPNAIVPTSTPQKTPMKTFQQPLPPITELSPKVSGVRTGVHGGDAVVAMHQLLQQWNPVGKRVADVKSMLGTPSEENSTQLVYRFDDGDQAYEWTLSITNGAISSVTIALHE